MSSLDHFDLVLTATHLTGFITICLNGYFFNTFLNGFGWPNGKENGDLGMRGKQLHGFLMSLGFIYFQGEALLAHRFYRYSSQKVTKIIHSILHFISLGSGITALVAMIYSINFLHSTHFSNLHSWLGAGFLIVYIAQLSLGIIVYLCLSEDYRSRWMPFHRAIGMSCMIVACAQCCLGYNQLLTQKKMPCFKDLSCVNRIEYVGALSMILNILYTLLVMAVVSPKSWRKTDDKRK